MHDLVSNAGTQPGVVYGLPIKLTGSGSHRCRIWRVCSLPMFLTFCIHSFWAETRRLRDFQENL